MFDLNTLIVGSIPLMVVIFGLVEFIKSLGLQGKILTVISLLLGLVLGLGYHFASSGFPADFSGWYTAGIFGLAMGLASSGFYTFVNDRFPKVDTYIKTFMNDSIPKVDSNIG